MLSINTNLSSLIAQSGLNSATLNLNQAVERMTTGYKLNHAKDNAANYSISTNLTTRIGAYQVAEDNAMQGLDLVNTMTSSIDLLNSHAQRIRELCEQASNGTYGNQSLQAIQSEVDARLAEIERIKSTTEYNGIKLFENETISSGVTGKFLAPVTQLTEEEAIAQGYTVVKTADELLTALNNNESVCLMNDIDMSGKQPTYGGGGAEFFVGSSYSETLEGNGYSITNLFHDNRTAFFRITNGAIIKNVEFKNVEISHDFVGLVQTNSGQTIIENVGITGSIECPSNLALFTNGSGVTVKNSYVNLTNCGPATVSTPLVYGTYGATVENSYFNNDIINDTTSPGGVSTAELDAILAAAQLSSGGDKSIALQIGTNGDSNSQISFVSSLALEDLAINVLDSDSARASLKTLDEYLAILSDKQTELGAVQNRLESALDEISTQYENLVSTRSTIRDADIAEVSATFIQQQILQQAASTLLSTANQVPSIALQLL